MKVNPHNLRGGFIFIDMKYLITESKLREAMFNFFDDYIKVETTGQRPVLFYDYNGVGWDDESGIVFFDDRWDDGEGEYFRYYTCEYFDNPPEICPLIDLSSSLESTFESVFPGRWKEPFLDWVRLNFDIKPNGIYGT